MATVGKLTQQGELQLAGNIDTRLPLVTDGLIAHFPMDGTTEDSNSVVWKNLSGMVVDPNNDNIISKSNASADWNSGAQSVQSYIGGDVFLEWSMNYIDDSRGAEMIGLSYNHSTNSYTDIAFAIYTHENNVVYVYENGADKGSKSTWDLSAGNVFRIEVVSNVVKYYHNGTLIYTSLNTPVFPIYADCSFHSHGAANSVINSSIGLMASTNTSTTITNDYVAVEEATTNKVPSAYNNGTTLFGGYNYDNTGTRVHEFTDDYYEGCRVIKYYTGTTGYKYFSITMSELVDGATYTFSYYARASVETNLNNEQLWRGTTDRAFTPDQNPTFTREWKKFVGTATVSGGTVLNFFPVHGSAIEGGVTVYFAGYQLEQKAFATEYVNGSRPQGLLKYNTKMTTESTISFDYFCKERISNTVISNSNFNFWWGLYLTSGGYLYTHEGHDGTSQTSTYLMPLNQWVNLTIKWTTTLQSYYADGVLLGTVATVGSANAANIPVLSLGFGWNVGNARFKNLSIYNRALSDSEIKKLAKGTHSITANGLISKHNINSRPYIPSDAYYFDLGANGKDEYKLITPTEDTANYSSGDAYVGGNSLEYNLNSSIGLNWGGNWSICYMKKPIGTSNGSTNLTGYNIESLGCNSNSVGGGYVWWGKTSGSNLIYQATNSTFTPSDYFNNWEYVTMVKTGTSIVITSYLKDRVVRSRTIVVTASANYYVTQYGYDLKLGGWDNNGGCYTHFRNLIVLKRAMTTDELNSYRLNKMKATKDGLYLQNGISSGIIL